MSHTINIKSDIELINCLDQSSNVISEQWMPSHRRVIDYYNINAHSNIAYDITIVGDRGTGKSLRSLHYAMMVNNKIQKDRWFEC